MKIPSVSIAVTLLAVIAAAATQPVQVRHESGLGTPVSDHQVLTVGHLGGGPVISDAMSDLVLIEFAPGTFASWATLSYEPTTIGQTVETAILRNAAIRFDLQTVQTLPGIFLQTEPLLKSGDSGGGVFDLAGNLVGVNFGVHPTTGNSYHIDLHDRRDWLAQNITMSQVPEPGVVALLVVGAVVIYLRRRG